MTPGFNLELDKELEELLEKWEQNHSIIPESISQVLVIWNYWECYLSNLKESSNVFFEDGFDFFEDLNKFVLHTFRVEVLDIDLLKFVWDYQKEKHKDQSKRFLN